MRARLPLLAVLLASSAGAAPPERRGYDLYKFQQRIGREEALVARDKDGAEIRTVFTFTDRTTAVPLAATLRLGPDGRPLRFQVWGNTARGVSVDDLVVASGKTLTITQRGETRTQEAPEPFFVGSAYAPVVMTEELLRFWAAHGKPARLAVVPMGEVTIERRGEDRLTDDEGHEKALARYAVGGLVWGHEMVWLDETGALAGLKGVDAEFDHFEATGRRWSQALPRFVELAAADGMAALAAMTPAAADTGPVAYVGGRLIDGTGAAAVPDSVVVVSGDRIVAAGPRARVTVPAGARTVDLGGKTILPGLWDMHAHFEQVEWGPIYLAAGVTTVRDCGNELDFIRSVRDTLAAGKGVGPRILLACIVDGLSPGAIGTERLRSAADIPALIARFRKAGCAQVKIYQSVPPQLIGPLSRAAHAAGMTVTGHVPTGIGATAAVRAGLDMINHIQFVLRDLIATSDADAATFPPPPVWDKGIAELDPASPAVRKKIALLAARKVVVDPTVALRELGARTHAELATVEPGLGKLPPPLAAAFAGMGSAPEDAGKRKAQLAKALQVVKALHDGGVAIVAGTDQAVPGHSLHRELELYVEAGFTPMEAIQAATIVPARAMKLDREVGTVAAGKRADLLVVDGDPLADVRALRRVVTVVAAGKAYEPAPLWKLAGFQP